MKKIEIAYDKSAAIVTARKLSAVVTFTQPKRATSVLVKSQDASNMAFWGDGNDFPQQINELIRKDVDLGPLLKKAAQLLYGGGITWGLPEVDEKNKKFLKPLDKAADKIVRLWMRRSNINRYLLEAATDLTRFLNAFPELVLQLDRKEIIQLCIQPAESCRWEKMDGRGVINNCYINPNFPDGKEGDKETKKVPVLDPYFDPAATLRENIKGWNFIYPLNLPTPGMNYYQLPEWYGIVESGWLAVSQAIPKFKLNLLNNQLNIKYHVEISQEFWAIRYPKWDSYTDAERDSYRAAELLKLQEVMTGVEGAGNSLITTMFTGQGSPGYSLWKITPIENKLQKGEFMEEVKESAIAKSMAVGIHPALVGTVANSGMGGAGSNIREAYNLAMVLNKAYQHIILEPLGVVRDYNGWPEEMEFQIENPFMTTLDEGKELTETKPK